MGVSVMRGRFRGASTLGWPGSSRNDSRRSLIGMPVVPAITDGSQAPLAVAENKLPRASAASMLVVSCDRGRRPAPGFSPPGAGFRRIPPRSPGGEAGVPAAAGPPSYFQGSPGRRSSEARSGSMSRARSRM